MALIGSSWARRGKLTGDGVVATVMSNLGLERFLAGRGLMLVRTQVGPIRLNDLKSGRTRKLSADEVGKLYTAAGL